MMKTKITVGIIAIIVLISSITAFILINQPNVSDDNTSDEGPDEIPELTQNNTTSFIKTINSFTFEFLQQMNQDPQKESNLFISPYSIFTALAMTYEGAKGNTAVEMADVLKIPQDNDSFHNYVDDLYTNLNKNDTYTISTANALWIKDNYPILDSYLSTVESYYHATSQSVDFSNPVEASEIINQWVENHTNGLIKDLVPPEAIDPTLCRLILTNAIYFKGTWKIEFDEANTTKRDFEIKPGDAKETSTMMLLGTEDTFNYTETETVQVLELPYDGDEISMIIALPKDDSDLSTVISSLDETIYDSWIDNLEQREVDIYLPKFKIETPVLNLNDYLQTLGLKDAFGNDADFSGITGNKDLLISDVLHKAYIDVNEEGTEAAAATAVIMELKSINGGGSSRVVFDCDHPFLFMLQHKETGTILFMGTLENPSY